MCGAKNSLGHPLFFPPFSVVRPTQIFGIFKKKKKKKKILKKKKKKKKKKK